MSPRAVEMLRAVTVIAAEDTRHSAPLLRHFAIAAPCVAFHDHNERERTEGLIQRLCRGDNVALISDAGTPLLSDPGFHLVRAAHDAGIRVIPVPGASAAIAALSASGLPTDRFAFEGFLPAKRASRRERLAQLRDEPRTLIFYEAPHRLLDALCDMTEAFGAEREGAIARELTKLHETVRKDALQNLMKWVQADPQQQKGECVILVHGALPTADDETKQRDAHRVLDILLKELPVKQAAALAAEITGERKNRLYERAVKDREK